MSSSSLLLLNCSRRTPCNFILISDKASPAAHKIGVVVLLIPETADLILCLSYSQPWSVGLSIQDEVMDVVRSEPQGAHYHAGIIYLLP